MPYFSKTSSAISRDDIKSELIELISNQLNKIDHQRELLLWINETNCYVSCHWYNSEKEESDGSDNYSVVEFDELLDVHEMETDESFYDEILNALNAFPKDCFKNKFDTKICIYETDELYEPTKIFEIDNGFLKIIEPPEGNWAANLFEDI